MISTIGKIKLVVAILSNALKSQLTLGKNNLGLFSNLIQ